MKKDNKGILKVVAIVIALVIVVALMLKYFMGRANKPVDETDSLTQEAVTEDEPVVEDEVEEVETTEEKEDEKFMIPAGNGFDKALADKAMNAKEFVQIEKLFTEIVDDGEGNTKTSYSEYYASEVSLQKMKDTTTDYTDCMTEDGYIDENEKPISFAEAFGFSYEGCRDFGEFLDLARKCNGFDADLMDASYDEDKYELMKEESYEYVGDCSVLYKMLGNMDYDRLIKSEAYYSLNEFEDGTKYPYQFTAIVQYEKGGVTYTKTAYMGVVFYNADEINDCSCSNGSGCGDDCGSCCEEDGDSCGCNGDEPCASCGGVGGCTDDCTGDCCK